ncbi:MAG TPA: hypothetical protein VLY82_03170 [Nitrososphaerales archaeon]|nr:hypothetical protein [Nitrososphaerales archaeon]
MASMVYPSSRYRSVTAATGIGDAHDGQVYNAGVLQNGGTGLLKLFSVQFGQPIPRLSAAGNAAPLQTYQQTYTLTTTNLDRPSQLGDNLGDAAIRGLSITLEQAAIVLTTGAPRTWGATQFEVAEITQTCAGEFKIGGKSQMQAPIFGYPQYGGVAGSVATTGNSTTASIALNGAIPVGRELRTPMMLGRYDSLVFEFSVANGYTLAFSAGTTDGRPILCWALFLVDFMSDVR